MVMHGKSLSPGPKLRMAIRVCIYLPVEPNPLPIDSINRPDLLRRDKVCNKIANKQLFITTRQEYVG